MNCKQICIVEGLINIAFKFPYEYQVVVLSISHEDLWQYVTVLHRDLGIIGGGGGLNFFLMLN
jgi:hypothetical protein